jgi:hypothetical protein
VTLKMEQLFLLEVSVSAVSQKILSKPLLSMMSRTSHLSQTSAVPTITVCLFYLESTKYLKFMPLTSELTKSLNSNIFQEKLKYILLPKVTLLKRLELVVQVFQPSTPQPVQVPYLRLERFLPNTDQVGKYFPTVNQEK